MIPKKLLLFLCSLPISNVLANEIKEDPVESIEVSEPIQSTKTVEFIEETKNPKYFQNDLIISNKTTYPYSEELKIRPLPKNHLLTSFDFQIASDPVDFSSSLDYINYKLFPRSITPLIEKTKTRELHLRFGQGWWDSDNWGELPNHGINSGGIGVEIWASIEAKTKEDAFASWISLTNSLSGLFCASMNFIDGSKTIYPVRSFNSSEEIPLFDPENNIYLIKAALPSEPVCTENLTPFIKFLPTRGKTGLSSLLDGHRVFESEWHMMSIDIKTECNIYDGLCQYKLDQKIDSVVDISRILRRKKNPIPKPVEGSELICDPTKPHDAFQCFPLDNPKQLQFTLSDIFGRPISGASLISEKDSKVCVDITESWSAYLSVDGQFYGTPSNCFELNENQSYDFFFKADNSEDVLGVSDTLVTASRSLNGYGQDKGGSRTVFRNPYDKPVRLIYLETLPWFMRAYMHTLSIAGGEIDDVVESIYYLPEIDRQRPTHIEFELLIPKNSTIALSYSFDKSLLLYAEYPPDANHGFSIEPGVIQVIEPEKYQFRTSPALLTLPTPDFSMPYNVIILTSTLIAYAFSSIYNLLTKRVIDYDDADFLNTEGSIKTKIRGRIHKIRGKINILKGLLPKREKKVPIDDKIISSIPEKEETKISGD
ncbi:hypothetical protein WICMUC_004340 [Wickerhamomyces mucosus]|uniref:GPI transamidase component n=1 Tax=Wickerhamomyces mucosus TaxID=1378264 RepID=A0A9P8TBC0_9ASCO|nr:hypothetical protein WICMUC_004340 [Wickerhamomyces mucosus]